MNKIRDSLLYSFHVIFHPFDGFWCAQREGKGDPRAATIIIALVTMVYILSKQLTGFIFNTEIDQDFNLFSELLGVIVPVLLWCVANWSITTLMDGEGSFKDIYIATAYSLVPLILINVPMIILSRIIVQEEQRIYQALGILAVVWTGFLIFSGLMTIHQHTATKTVVTILIAVVAMAAMLFLFLLFFALIQQLINFVYMFYKEMTLRLY
ncbi:MAG: YIP1 family protein [Clostridiales bacterium]|nr:YIP1 family protein [Clostridiales bacterium]